MVYRYSPIYSMIKGIEHCTALHWHCIQHNEAQSGNIGPWRVEHTHSHLSHLSQWTNIGPYGNGLVKKGEREQSHCVCTVTLLPLPLWPCGPVTLLGCLSGWVANTWLKIHTGKRRELPARMQARAMLAPTAPNTTTRHSSTREGGADARNRAQTAAADDSRARKHRHEASPGPHFAFRVSRLTPRYSWSYRFPLFLPGWRLFNGSALVGFQQVCARKAASAHEQISQSKGLSLNRSQCGSCSTKYDTPAGT